MYTKGKQCYARVILQHVEKVLYSGREGSISQLWNAVGR